MTVRCPVCGDEFETEQQLAAHDHEVPVITEHAGSGFECPDCGQRFDAEEHLIEHQAAGHSGVPG